MVYRIEEETNARVQVSVLLKVPTSPSFQIIFPFRLKTLKIRSIKPRS